MLTKLVARLAAIATTVLTALTAVVCVAVPVAVADKGLDVTSTYTYTIDAETDAVRVQADLTFTNTVPNRTEGNYINKTYFNSFTLPIPKNTGAIFATQDGAPLTVTPRELPESETFGLINIDFAKNLFYQKTVHVQITYNIVGSAPRTPFDPSRVNDAYAAFNAYGIADEGKLTIRVVVPGSYQIDTFGSTATRTEENGEVSS